MTLQAIIIRADGAFAETEELRRKAFIAAFNEAGFDWTIDRTAFGVSRRLGSVRDRLAYFVRQFLKRGGQPVDVEQLVSAMHRRACKVFQKLIADGGLEPRSGIRELVVTARQEDVRLVLAGNMKREDADNMLVHALGSRGPEMFDSVALVNNADKAVDDKELYRQALSQLNVDPNHCLVVESTVQGAAAAAAVGLRVITTRSAFCTECPSAGDSIGFFEDLPSVMARSGEPRLDTFSAEQRAELFSALQALHCDADGTISKTSTRAATMRVSDILKTKGSAVKTVEPTATIRALAQAMKLEGVGAMIVKSASGGVAGIISERDLARGLAQYGDDMPALPVTALMTETVITCSPEDTVATVAKVMTQRRIRHLPVLIDGKLAGVVSIGDVLKHRLDEVQLEANVLRDFALARK